MTRSVASELMSRGHEVRLLTANPNDQVLGDSDRFHEYDFHGMHVYCFEHDYVPMAGQTSVSELTYENRLANDYFVRILEEFGPDVVHFFHLSRLGTGLIEKTVAAGVPAFMTPTDFWSVCPTSQLVLCNGYFCNGPSKYAGNCLKHSAAMSRKWMTRLIARWTPGFIAELITGVSQFRGFPLGRRRDEVRAIISRLPTNVARLNKLQGIFSPSQIMSDVLVRHGVSPRLIINSSYGISDTTRDAGISRCRPNLPLRFGFIGTLVHHKGCHLLIEAIRDISPDQAVLKIYGRMEDYPQYSYNLELIANKQSSIQFCGTFPNSEIGDIFAGIDVLVVPSLWNENTPLVIYSAQSACCPIIGSDYPGIAEVVQHNVNGLLFEGGNVEALRRQILRLVKEPDLAVQLGANAQMPKSIGGYVDELLRYWG